MATVSQLAMLEKRRGLRLFWISPRYAEPPSAPRKRRQFRSPLGQRGLILIWIAPRHDGSPGAHECGACVTIRSPQGRRGPILIWIASCYNGPPKSHETGDCFTARSPRRVARSHSDLGSTALRRTPHEPTKVATASLLPGPRDGEVSL